MAEKITCICGREFHITRGKPCQCRKCGREYSADRIGPTETLIRRLCGQPIGTADSRRSDRPRDKQHSSRGTQTRKKPPSGFDPVTAAWQIFFGR